MATYMLNRIDADKWRRFKAACDLSGITMRESFIQHINYTIVKVLSDQITIATDNLKQKQGGKKK